MSVLDTFYKYPKDYVFQKEFYSRLLEELKQANTNNKTFAGYDFLDFSNMIIGGSANTNPWKSLRQYAGGGVTDYKIQRIVNYSNATYPSSLGSVGLLSSGNTSVVYPTERWFILAENSEDFTFYRGRESSEVEFSFDFCGPNSNTYTNFIWFGTVINTDSFKQAINQDTTLSFYVKSSAGLNGQNLVCSIWKLADGTNWNLPESTTDPTHTFTTTFSVASSGFNLVEINIPALSDSLDWGDGIDPAIAVVFQMGNIPSSDLTPNLDTWETGYYKGYNNGSYYITDWVGEVIRFRDFRLEVGNTRSSTKFRNSELERLLCSKYYYSPTLQYSSQAYEYWFPYSTFLVPYMDSYYYNRITLGQTDSQAQMSFVYPQLDAPFNTHSTGVAPISQFTDPVGKDGVHAYFNSGTATVRQNQARFSISADYYYGSIS